MIGFPPLRLVRSSLSRKLLPSRVLWHILQNAAALKLHTEKTGF